MFSLRKLGFTMIELLIVIAVLGILAVAVLSAINPIEQINRGRDTGSRGDAEQLLSAIDRYYASQGIYPWQADSEDVDNQGNAPLVGAGGGFADVSSTDFGDGSQTVLEKLTDGGTAELKSSFVTRITNPNNTTLKAYNRGGQGDSTYVCFIPKSGAFLEEAVKRCGGTGQGETFGQDLPDDLTDVADEVCVAADATNNMVCLP